MREMGHPAFSGLKEKVVSASSAVKIFVLG
jgi:hypothetical protein